MATPSVLEAENSGLKVRAIPGAAPSALSLVPLLFTPFSPRRGQVTEADGLVSEKEKGSAATS